MSLLNFASIAKVPSELRAEYFGASVAFGVVSFAVSLLVLLQDRSQRMLISKLPYTKARDGYVEGCTLASMAVWWVFGVAYVTRPGGIAYVASNIYYSAWGCLFSCVYTLDRWSAEKDILSLAEITGLSYTLKAWWVHFLSSCVVFSSSLNLHVRLERYDTNDTSFGIALGLVSMAMAFFFILVHYNFLSRCELEEGGWMELLSSFFLILVWVIGIAILTQDGGIAATMEGNQCGQQASPSFSAGSSDLQNCTVTFYGVDSSGAVTRYEYDCADIPRQVPGSNLYFACWTCMLSALFIAFRWKAAQAIQFAQAREEKKQVEDVDDDASEFDGDEDDDRGGDRV